MAEINFIYTIGFRCVSPNFLSKYKLIRYTSPFDWIYVDFETALSEISSEFSTYLSDIVAINKSKKSLELFYPNNFSNPCEKIYKLLDKNIYYMGYCYNNVTLIINQNYLDDTLDGNIFNWERELIFLHEDIREKEVYDKVYKRCSGLIKVIKKDPEKVLLLHISRIIPREINIDNLIEKMMNIIEKYKICTYFSIILCCENEDDSCKLINKCLFIIKKVPKYAEQIRLGLKTDNDVSTYNYDNEFSIMNKYYDFNNLKSKPY